jgi:iron(III) transport system permease protein
LLLLGGGSRLFFHVGLPLLWPSATAGTILVCLEVLNDFGVTSHYGLTTFTTAIFTAWFGMGDTDTAVKLAGILLCLVFVILLLRKAAHKTRRYHIVSSKEKPLAPIPARGRIRLGILLLCCVSCLAGFVLPLIQMLHWFLLTHEHAFTRELAEALRYTLFSAGIATLLVMAAATAIVNANRLFAGKIAALLSQGATLGYTIPSAVLAIGLVSLFVGMDKLLARVFPDLPAMLLSMSSTMLIAAYAIRFFTIGYQSVESGFAKIGKIYTEASRTLGRSVTRGFFLVDMPLIRHALVSGSTLVFIDIIKELPLSLLLRPFNTETLGTSVYHFANNEALEETALPSLCIVLAGALFIILTQLWEKRRAGHVFGN